MEKEQSREGPHFPSVAIFRTSPSSLLRKQYLGSLRLWKVESSLESSVSERKGHELRCEAASQAQQGCLNQTTTHPLSGIREAHDSSLRLTTPCSVSSDKLLPPHLQSERTDKTSFDILFRQN